MQVVRDLDPDAVSIPDGDPARLLFAGLVTYFLVDRLIPDVFVLPVGASIRPNQAILGFLGLLWIYAMIVRARPIPMGVAGILSVAVLGVIFLAPLVNDAYLTTVQADGVERGGMFAIFLTALFLASYYVGQRVDLSFRLIVLVVILTVVQGALAIYEASTLTHITRAWGPAVLSLGLEVDPGLARGFSFGAFRPGGFRPTATSPHPLVLSAVLGLGVLLWVGLYLGTKGAALKALIALAILVQMYALLVSQTRTGFLIVAIGAIAALGLSFRREPMGVLSVALAGVVSLGAAVLTAPRSARVVLNLFTRVSTDTSIQARVQDYSIVPDLIARHPVLGLGYFTHTPDVLLLDNSYLGTLVELGILGGVTVFTFIIALTIKPIRPLANADLREGVVLLSGILAGLALLFGMAVFDALKFAQFLPTALVLLALAAARVDDTSRESKLNLRADVGHHHSSSP